MIGIPIGLAVANASEWFVHKYVLHGLGRRKESFWSFHWHEHHKNARRNAHVDADYRAPLFGTWNGQSKEAVALLAGAAVPSARNSASAASWRRRRFSRRFRSRAPPACPGRCFGSFGGLCEVAWRRAILDIM